MSNLQKQQAQSENSIQTYNDDMLKASLALAFDRLKSEPFPVDNMIKDIRSCYPKEKNETIINAIKEGTKGKYGRTYRFCFQEVSMWIIEYRKETLKQKSIF